MLIVFGHDANTVEQEGDVIQSEFEVILPAISRRFFALIPTWRYVQTPSDRRVKRAVVNVRAWLGEVLAEARTRLQSEPEGAGKPSNFVEAMVTTRDENGEPFSDDVIMSNLLTMLIAGEDTTSVTLTWAIHQLCDSPRWTSEIRREADKIVGASTAPASHDVASQLICAGAVATETMRLRPVAPFFFTTLPLIRRWGRISFRRERSSRRFCVLWRSIGRILPTRCVSTRAMAGRRHSAAQPFRLHALRFGSADVSRQVARAS